MAQIIHPISEVVTFEDAAKGKPLSKLRVTHLTQALIEHNKALPRSDVNFKKALGERGLTMIPGEEAETPTSLVSQRQTGRPPHFPQIPIYLGMHQIVTR